MLCPEDIQSGDDQKKSGRRAGLSRVVNVSM